MEPATDHRQLREDSGDRGMPPDVFPPGAMVDDTSGLLREARSGA